MSYRHQKDYLDEIERRLTARYGRKPHERELDQTCSEQVLRSGFESSKQKASKRSSKAGSSVSLPEPNKSELCPDSNFIQERSYYNHTQCEKNRAIVAKRSKT